MAIASVEIENFKSIRKAHVELNPINILIGANGVGKSNFIGFFKLLYNIRRQKLQNAIAFNRVDNVLYFGRKVSESLKGSIIFKNNEDKITNKYEFELIPDQRNSLIFKNEKGCFNRSRAHNIDWYCDQYGGREESFIFQVSPLQYGVEGYLKKYFSEFNIYHFHDTSRSSTFKQANKIKDNRWLREDGSNLAAFLYKLQQTNAGSFKVIEKTIQSIALFFDRFDLAPDGINPELIDLVWLEKGSDQYFNAYNLSDGTLRMIALTTLLLQPELPKTMIIDEPELGLHPFAINKLAALIKSASEKSQLIVSTQSVGLLDNFMPEDVLVVERKDKQTVFHRLNELDLKDWLEDYSLGELWEKNVIGGRL